MSFQQGLSGLNATSKQLEVIGNNVANANTIGAKASRAEFADMFANAINGAGASAVGIGVNVAAVSQQFTQGNISTTNNPLDMAINGADGFFQVSVVKRDTSTATPTVEPDGAPLYSRNGQFKTDNAGFIVNNQGQVLMGYGVDSAGNVVKGTAGLLKVPTEGIKASATTSLELAANVDSRATDKIAAGYDMQANKAIDFTLPETYNYATSVTAYDVKGQSVSLTYYFQKVSDADPTAASAADNSWNVYVTANGKSMASYDAADPNNRPIPVATIQFPSNGGYPTDIDTANPGTILQTSLNPDGTPTGDPAVSQTKGIIDLPDVPQVSLTGGGISESISGLTLDLSKMTEYGASFGISNLAQNGNASAQLSSVKVEGNGVIKAVYSNGVTRAVGQVELVSFRNPQGLQSLGGNAWSKTVASGEPSRKGTPGESGLGVLQSGALEESNVDLTAELINMITAQRVYQANAQTVKTQDQLLQTLVNLR
jgi:flagellar hook protein FlgE